MKGYSTDTAAYCVAWFEMGGLIGMLLAGWCSDRWFEGRRVPFMGFCAFGLIFALMGFWYSHNYLWDTFFVALVGFLTYGPQMLVGLAAAEFVSKKAASTANGFASTWAYLGAAVAGWPVGAAIDNYGWEIVFLLLILCAFITLLILLPLWYVRSGERFSTKIIPAS
jgi:OPA family sugar phosphate sensor protein UhpC-like MFS transporter